MPVGIAEKALADTQKLTEKLARDDGAALSHGGAGVTAPERVDGTSPIEATTTSTTTTEARDIVQSVGTGHANRLLEIVKGMLGVDDATATRMLGEHAGLRQAARLFAWVGGGDAVAGAHRHRVVNTDDATAPGAGGAAAIGAAEAHVKAYARAWGFDDARFEGGRLRLHEKDGSVVDAGKINLKANAGKTVEQLVRELGRMVNQARVGAPTTIPPTLPVDAAGQDLTPANALLSNHLSMLAYKPEAAITAQLQLWGFDTSTFTFLNDKVTDTQGFVCKDAQGVTHVVFRGTESGVDARIDASAGLRAPSWTPFGSDVEVHKGFDDSLAAVWQQVKGALTRARPSGDGPVMFSGHSLGGALTQLAALRAVCEGAIAKDAALVVTQGGPRCMNEAGKGLYEERLPRTYRMVHSKKQLGFDNDPVTGIPPKISGFRHAGHMAKITAEACEIVRAGTPGTRSALEARMLGAANVVVDDASDPELTPPPPLHAQHASGAALESMRMLGVELHFIAGYLEDTGKEVIRKLL